MSSTLSAREVVLQLVQYFTEVNYDGLLALATPDATWWNSGLIEQNPIAGTRSFKDRLTMARANSTITGTMTMEILDLVVGNVNSVDGVETAVLETKVTAKGPKASEGQVYENDIIMIFKIKEGRITEAKEYMDYYPVAKYLSWGKEKKEEN